MNAMWVSCHVGVMWATWVTVAMDNPASFLLSYLHILWDEGERAS